MTCKQRLMELGLLKLKAIISPIPPVVVTWSRKYVSELDLNKLTQTVWTQQYGTHLLHSASSGLCKKRDIYCTLKSSQNQTWEITHVCISFSSGKWDKPDGFNPAKSKDKSELENYSTGLLGTIKSVFLLMMSMAKLALTEVARN